MDFKVCPLCGSTLHKTFTEGRDRMVCDQCGYIQYQNPLPASAVIVIEDGAILMVKRKFEPQAGKWGLPAGFVELDETPEQAAVRETHEETGINVKIKRLLKVTGTCEGHKSNIVLIIYIAEKIDGVLAAGDDAEEAAFFPIHDLPENIAFSSHKQAILEYINHR